jgi:hypothetical protein
LQSDPADHHLLSLNLVTKRTEGTAEQRLIDREVVSTASRIKYLNQRYSTVSERAPHRDDNDACVQCTGVQQNKLCFERLPPEKPSIVSKAVTTTAPDDKFSYLISYPLTENIGGKVEPSITDKGVATAVTDHLTQWHNTVFETTISSDNNDASAQEIVAMRDDHQDPSAICLGKVTESDYTPHRNYIDKYSTGTTALRN